MGKSTVHMAGATMVIIYAYIAALLAQVALVPTMANNATSLTDMSTAILIRVDPSGNGDFKKIQDAIDAVPSHNSEPVFISIKPGIYGEKITVPVDKPVITLSGEQASNTIITCSDGGNIFESPTVTIFGADFVARHLTVQNTHPGKAVALRVAGDRAAFDGCRIIAYQDTLLDDEGTHYYSRCYIEGATDFICGDANSLFERCHLHSVSQNHGSITAQHRSSETDNTGYTFLGCKITGNGTAFLGRPWGAYSKVVFAFTYMSSSISPAGWDDWPGQHTRESTVFYAEYNNYGPGADRSKRVNWSRSLSDDEAAPFLRKDIMGGGTWLRPLPTQFKRISTIVKPGGNA